MSGKFHELLAVEADLHKTSEKMLAEALTTFEKKPDHFQGQVRKVAYLKEERSGENTQDEKALVTTVTDKLEYALGHFGRYLDAVFQKELTNQTANADLIVDGITIATGLPSVFLLGLEQKLTDLRKVILVIPTLNPSIVWHADATKGEGVFTSAPQEQLKTEKVEEWLTVAAATEKHPAQVQKVTKDYNVAKITTILASGMWTPARKAQVLANLDGLIIASKKARMRANLADIKEGHMAMELISALLAD